VWKNIFQTGIYRPVKLLLDSPGTNAAPAVKHRTAQQPPLVTIVSDDDPCEIVKFRGQAYVRYADGRIIARGDLTGFCIAAPGLPAQGAVTVNGIPAKYETVGDYVVVGDAGKPEGNAKALSVIAEKDAPGSPVELEFPQQLVNIDAEQGGYMVVRVTNIVSPQVSGRIEVAPAPGLAVSGGSQRIEGVKAGHRSERVFQLKAAGCKPGTLQPVRVRLYVGNAGQERLAWETWRKVAVGVVVEQVDYAWIQEQFTYPGYKLPGVFKGQQGFVFDVVRVRAPGYTIDIDKWSGAARWILQPDGTLGWKTATYPYRWLRDEDPRLREQTDFGPGDWFKRAVFEGLSTDQETGQTVAAFRSEDGARTWSYSFAPGRVQSSENGKAGDDAGFGMPTAPAPIDNEPIIPPQIQTTEK
jgi:hypothetical protein